MDHDGYYENDRGEEEEATRRSSRARKPKRVADDFIEMRDDEDEENPSYDDRETPTHTSRAPPARNSSPGDGSKRPRGRPRKSAVSAGSTLSTPSGTPAGPTPVSIAPATQLPTPAVSAVSLAAPSLPPAIPPLVNPYGAGLQGAPLAAQLFTLLAAQGAAGNINPAAQLQQTAQWGAAMAALKAQQALQQQVPAIAASLAAAAALAAGTTTAPVQAADLITTAEAPAAVDAEPPAEAAPEPKLSDLVAEAISHGSAVAEEPAQQATEEPALQATEEATVP